MSSTNCRLKIENEYCIEKHERNVQIIRLKQKANYLSVLMLLEVKKKSTFNYNILINIQAFVLVKIFPIIFKNDDNLAYFLRVLLQG